MDGTRKPVRWEVFRRHYDIHLLFVPGVLLSGGNTNGNTVATSETFFF